MKNCKILVGPIAGENGVNHNEGDFVALDDATAAMFARFGYVTIELDPEPTPIASGLSGFKDGQDFAAGVVSGSLTPDSTTVPVSSSPSLSVPLIPNSQLPTPDSVGAAALQGPPLTLEPLIPEPEVKETIKSKKSAPEA